MHARFFAAALAVVAAGCAPAEVPSIALAASQAEAVADGVTTIELTAHVVPGDAIVTFTGGPGLLANASVQAKGGTATTTVFAPTEADLETEIGGDAVFHAEVITNEGLLTADAPVRFTHPTEGPPVLRLTGQPRSVLAGAGGTVQLQLRGRRLDDTASSVDVAIASDTASFAVPAHVTMTKTADGEFVFDLDVAVPADPATVNVTASLGDVSDDTQLRFTAEGESLLQLTGDFAQLSWGTVLLSDFSFLEHNTECVIAKTVNLVHVEQEGDTLHVTNTACLVTMPAVPLKDFAGGTIVPQPGPGFLAASNRKGAGQSLDFDVAYDSRGVARWNPPASEFEPLTVGAHVAADEPLPTADQTSETDDDDLDGEFGVTIFAAGTEQHTAFRTTLQSMTAVIHDDNTITGDTLEGDGMISNTDTVIYGGQFSGIGPKITNIRSPWQMKRVDGIGDSNDIRGIDGDDSTLSCADVNGFAETMALSFASPNSRVACD